MEKEEKGKGLNNNVEEFVQYFHPSHRDYLLELMPEHLND